MMNIHGRVNHLVYEIGCQNNFRAYKNQRFILITIYLELVDFLVLQ